MTYQELHDCAKSLPLEPGVYIMMDITGKVIYVGKAKKLRNRVSSYFTDLKSHNQKTIAMISKIDHFDTIIAKSEFEALVLESSLIKRHQPHYNILLKDDKGYPFIKINDKDEYPKMTLSADTVEDGSKYFGPFGTRGKTNQIIEAITKVFRLPTCNRHFPRDIGKERPCLNYQIGLCAGFCLPELTSKEYKERFEQIESILSGDFRNVLDAIKQKMLLASEHLNFEQAAQLRDQMNAIAALSEKQTVSHINRIDTDAVGYYQNEEFACVSILHYINGSLVDKEYAIFRADDTDEQTLSAYINQYYFSRNCAPQRVFLPFSVEDAAALSELLSKQHQKKVTVTVPQKGINHTLVLTANKNAMNEWEHSPVVNNATPASILQLGDALGIAAPERIESYDISNTAGSDIVSSCVVFIDGKPSPRNYKRFRLDSLKNQDDYLAMRITLERRFQDYYDSKPGFEILPQLLMIDGGKEHAKVAENTIMKLNLNIPIVGMVKDDRHRTRALVRANGKEIGLTSNALLFSLVGQIQEETHRFAISYHKTLRSNRLKHSVLDEIPGIGPKRKQALLQRFHSITQIKEADMEALHQILPAAYAEQVYLYFHRGGKP